MKKTGVNVEKFEKNAKICFFCQFSIIRNLIWFSNLPWHSTSHIFRFIQHH